MLTPAWKKCNWRESEWPFGIESSGETATEHDVNGNHALALALAIGIVAGLRSMTAPAAVSWAAHLGRLNLRGTALGFMETIPAVGILSILAVAEFVVDLLPQTPNRTEPASLAVRVVTGGLSGACLCVSAGHAAIVGAVLGAIGGVTGAFAGFQARTRLVTGLKVPGAVIAIPEDLLAIGLAWLILFGI
jgi:uncharacterized membrane protein